LPLLTVSPKNILKKRKKELLKEGKKNTTQHAIAKVKEKQQQKLSTSDLLTATRHTLKSSS